MVRIAQERVTDLFGLAQRAASGDHPELADRYVRLARRIGMRYNVRLLPEFRELYCRSCSTFWVEGRTVRTRLRDGHRVRTCLSCGRARRTRVGRSVPKGPGGIEADLRPLLRDEGALIDFPSEPPREEPSDEETEEP